MALADLDNVKKRVIRILNANESAWSASVSGTVGAFPDISEITAAILEADEMVITKGYFQSMNATLAQPFMTLSSNIASGDKIPFYYGKHGKVLLSTDNFVTSKIGTMVQSADDITMMVNFASSYLESGSSDHLYFIDKANGLFLHPATYGKIELPVFTRTSVLQAMQSEESLIVATAIRLLTKHATPALFDIWRQESVNGINQLITDGKYVQSSDLDN